MLVWLFRSAEFSLPGGSVVFAQHVLNHYLYMYSSMTRVQSQYIEALPVDEPEDETKHSVAPEWRIYVSARL